MPRAITTALLLLALLVPATAEGAVRHVVRGAGFGHGIGMSQYGAYGFAQKGFGFKRILAHYYRGTELADAPSRPVRVLLQASTSRVRFRGATRATGGERLNRRAVYTVRRARGGRITLSRGRKRIGTFSRLRVRRRRGAPVRLLGTAINGLSSGRYRGTLELRPGLTGGVTAVNALPIDPYVQGVVAGEMPSTWDYDALRSQAVAARTYALATRKRGGVFDQYPDTRSQVYLGVKGETARTNTAVRDTGGKILTYGGEPAVTYYFSTSGGRTENVELSFLGSEPKPWLKSVKDPYDDISPRHRWRFRFSTRELGARLGARGLLRKVRVLKRGRSPRIVRARVYGTRGTTLLTGPEIRARLDLYDSWAYFTRVSTSQSRSRRGARAAGAFPELAGSFDPAPRSRRLLVERRRGNRWTRVARIDVSRRGRYRSTVAVSGTYRVRAGRVAGPAVRVRR
ncbi:MAG: SpoIID/LytB domain-containing protein [Thermoleophilaceae bacterium]